MFCHQTQSNCDDYVLIQLEVSLTSISTHGTSKRQVKHCMSVRAARSDHVTQSIANV